MILELGKQYVTRNGTFTDKIERNKTRHNKRTHLFMTYTATGFILFTREGKHRKDGQEHELDIVARL